MAVYRNRSRDIVERLILLRDYIHTNASPTHAVKAADMLTHLKDNGICIEIKTLYADLDMLGTCFRDVKIHYDGRQKGYLLDEPPLSSYDLRLIVNSIQAAQFITQEEANSLTDKMIGLADEYTRKLLDRRTLVVNRARTMNDRLMKDLDTIYEAIAQDKKVSFKYFEYVPNGSNRTKRYHNLNGSKIISASPYAVVWESERFWLCAVLKVPKDIWYKSDLTYDDEYGGYIDYTGDIIYEGECIDFQYEDMDDTGLYVYDSIKLDLGLIEQITIREEKREGRSQAQNWLDGNIENDFSEIVKLKVDYGYVCEIIDKFGSDIPMIPGENNTFVAIVHGYPTPELYMWTHQFDPPIKIIYPQNAEADLKSYFLSLSKGETPDDNYYGFKATFFPYDNIR